MIDTAHPLAFARRGLVVVAINLGIAAVMAISRPDKFTFVQQLVYAQGIGLTTWLMIDFGRFAVERPEGAQWPQGWRAFALPAVGILVGNLVGSWVGDQFSGHSRWTAITQSPRMVFEQLFLIFAIGASISYLFWTKGYSVHLRNVVEATQREAAEAQLRLLQSQLEPHMLFNTLANLQVLIGTDPPRAQALLDHLIAYLRSTLSGSRATQHPLSTEFARTADYLALMKIRMGDRLDVDLDLPDDLSDVAVPSLLLQPLVENAVQHGLEPHVEGGRLTVRAQRDGGHLLVTVRDTGAGLSPRPAGPDGGSHYGLDHVRQRLATRYGDAATLTLAPAGDTLGGTVAAVRLPIQVTP